MDHINNVKNEMRCEPLDRRTRNLESYALIYNNIPKFINENSDRMRTIIDFIEQIDNMQMCIDRIRNGEESKIFLIVSNENVKELLATIHQLPKLHSVFVTGEKTKESEDLIKTYPKIEGIFNETETLEKSLQNAVNQFLINDNGKIDRSLNTFRGDLWLLKVFYTLIRQTPPEENQNDFYNLFCGYYKTNSSKMKTLNEFIKDYHASKAIWWYTKSTFIFDVLNEALRKRNVEIICAFHFFINDLYKNIEEIHRSSSNGNNSSFCVYRGQKIHRMDIDRIKEANKLDLRLATNTFFSATLDSEIAKVFIVGVQPKNDVYPVLFQIECDSKVKSRPFADIRHLSAISDEREVLFAPGVVFTVISIDFDEFYLIKLKICDENEILRGFHKKNIFNGDRETVRELFKNLSWNSDINDCRPLDQLFFHVSKLFPSDKIIEAEYFVAVGSRKVRDEDFPSAIENYKRSLQIKETLVETNRKELVDLYYEIGELFFKLKNFDETIQFCEKSIESDELGPMKTLRSHFYLGISYLKKNETISWTEISLAKKHLENSLNLIQDDEENIDESINVEIYKALALINERYEGDFDSAERHLTKAFEISERNAWINETFYIEDLIEELKTTQRNFISINED